MDIKLEPEIEDLNMVRFRKVEIKNTEDLHIFIKEISKVFSNIYADDTLTINSISEGEQLESEHLNLENFSITIEDIYNLNIAAGMDENELFELELILNKKQNNITPIYYLDLFIDQIFLVNKSEVNITEMLLFFSERKSKNKNAFKLINLSGTFRTTQFIFSDSDYEISRFTNQFTETIEEKIYSNFHEFGNIIGLNLYQLKLLPDYFIAIENTSKEFDKLNRLFLFLTSIFSLVLISNISKIDGENLEYKIVGYKNIEEEINLTEIFNIFDYSNNVLYKIFNWVYLSSDQNTYERIGIARNILSLYVKNSLVFEVTPNILDSLKSNYDIYLKENVENYINVLNHAVELMNSISIESIRLADDFSSKFKNGFNSFITFFISTILITVISEGELVNIFTDEIYLISMGFILLSICYLIFSYVELKDNIVRINILIDENISRYTTILDKDEVNKIFNVGKDGENKITNLLKKSRNRTLFLWGISLSILTVIITICNKYSVLKMLWHEIKIFIFFIINNYS